MKLTNPIKYALGIGATGLIISALVIFVERKMVTTNSKNQPYIALGEYLKNISTKAHLWFEEAMAGDETINVEKDVYGYLDLSVETLESALAGKETELGKFHKTNDTETIKIINESISDVKDLRKSAEKRWAFKLEAEKNKQDTVAGVDQGEAAGGILDQEFDTAYEELQDTYDRLVNHVKTNVANDNAMLDGFSWTSIALIVIVFTLLSFLLYRIQFKSDTMDKARSAKLEEESRRISSLSDFIQAISAGKFEYELNMTDELGEKLVDMRNNLKTNSENEQRRIWASTGMAQIGDILRSNYTAVAELYDNILKFVVTYSKSNQGSLFILNDDSNDKFLELVATYAFDRKKFVEKKIEIGSGLAGQCFLEGQTIFMTDIPQDYVKITSGLGEANPTALVIVPLKINEKIYGILELAAFRKYGAHEVELIEKFAESIASTISSVKVNERTRILLEKTQQQAEEMRAQEEEMRQNMEELSATQEEMSRKEKEYIIRIKELETVTA
ncbi:MAG TPA: GAF domain-containing protein [Cyclobacteriaceae bacterium]|nr:GAF domain-containing protein [Cyclobacteriaceae bacterium]